MTFCCTKKRHLYRSHSIQVVFEAEIRRLGDFLSAGSVFLGTQVFMLISRADLSAPDVQELLKLHLDAANKQRASAAYSAEKLAASDVFLVEARDGNGNLMGFAGLKILDPTHGEIKSVRTHPNHLRKGVSLQLMKYLTEYAQQKGLQRLSLETHPTAAYDAARALYERLGYTYCEPFGDYVDTDTSVYMTICL